eukprot:scaffold4852_cov148-Isochrysis_galbana.AAC.1
MGNATSYKKLSSGSGHHHHPRMQARRRRIAPCASHISYICMYMHAALFTCIFQTSYMRRAGMRRTRRRAGAGRAGAGPRLAAGAPTP